MDAKLYLGYESLTAIQQLRGVADPQRVLWCAVGHHERTKCDSWSAVSGGALQCTMEETTQGCIATIVKGEADAISSDAGFIYTVGKCWLVPILAENYMPEDGNEQPGSQCVNTRMEGSYVVAVVKKSDAHLTWNSLQGKKSYHGAVGTSTGCTIPMGLIYNQTSSWKLGIMELLGLKTLQLPADHVSESMAMFKTPLTQSANPYIPSGKGIIYEYRGSSE
ncbi:Serotransferrin [Manis pentadactyla]|nr:Serotransferrin [Manis pentadactyla]